MNLQDSAQRGCSYSFLDFTIDLAAERLVRGTSEIKLRPKSFQVLRHLVESHGRLVTRDELMQSVWGDVVVTDESITKCIADIRKALADDSQEIVRTVTRRGFLFLAEVRIDHPSHPSDEQQRPPQSPGFHPERPFHSRRAKILSFIVLFGFVAGLAFVQWRFHPFNRKPAFEAIAVLPFESLSTGADQQYLADGMTEALITDLGQVSPLRVIARTSVNQYLKTKKSIREIARELNVDVVVEGTIAQSGDRLRVTANLIQVSPEKHIWARSYERNFRDALTLQNEIAGAIAGEIQGKLTPQQQSRLASNRPVNPEAQIAHWKARYFMHVRRNAENAKKSMEYSELAVRIAPEWAPAHAGLARSYDMLSNFSVALPSEAMPRARMAAQRAIALDEELAEAHVALGLVLYAHYWDWTGAERELRRALTLNPSDADAHHVLANYLASVGRLDESVAEIRRARELDPFSFLINRDVGRILYFGRKYDEALAELRQAGDMQPNSSVVDLWIVKCRWEKGQADDAVAADLRVRRERDGFNAELLEALRTAYSKKGSLGYWSKVRELVLRNFRSTAQGSYSLAEINIYLGDQEEAFQWLEKAYQLRSGFMPWIKVDPSLDPLRPDPRFSALLGRMGLMP